VKNNLNLIAMKKICLLFFILAATCAAAQNKDYIISMEGLGALKLGMSQAKVEELLNKKIALTKNYLDTLNGYYEDTAKVTYKNIAVQLEFQRSYTAPYKFYMRLIGIRARSPLCKTATGIGIGSDKLKIITDYDNYHVNIQPGYVTYYSTEKGNGKSTMSILDDAASTMDGSDAYTMVFYLLNKKVVSFELKAKLKDER
jgi:hypothetical protein